MRPLGEVATERDVERVGQAAHRATAEVELRHVDEHDLEAPRLELGAHAAGQAGITTVRPTTTELAQSVLIASSSVITSGSGTSASSASADAGSSASGQTIARRSSSGQKARSRWYIPGCVIRSPGRYAEVGREVLERELVGARTDAHDQLAPERERVAGLEVGADALASDVRRREAVGLEPPLRRWGSRCDAAGSACGT